MRKSFGATLLSMALLAPVLAACGTGGTTTTATAVPAATAATAPTAAAAPTMMMEPTAAATAATEATAAPEATGTASGDGSSFKVGLVTDVGKINDGTFNQFAYEGLKRAEEELGIETAYIETQAQADYNKNIDQLASQDFDMIIGVGFLMGDAIAAAAEKYPDIKFAIVDFAYDPSPANVQGLVFSEDESGYLAGALAALMSKSGVVGSVGGIEIPPVQKFLIGFENGAKSINPDIQVNNIYTDSFTDRARGAEVARDLISQGADVIFGAGGQTGSGGIQAAAQQGVFVIGVDQDEYGTTFQNGSAPGADKLLSSAIKRVDTAVFDAVKSLVDGTFEGSTVVFSAANEGVGLAPFHDADAAIPADVKAKLEEIQKGLADGSIKTNVVLP